MLPQKTVAVTLNPKKLKDFPLGSFIPVWFIADVSHMIYFCSTAWLRVHVYSNTLTYVLFRPLMLWCLSFPIVQICLIQSLHCFIIDTINSVILFKCILEINGCLSLKPPGPVTSSRLIVSLWCLVSGNFQVVIMTFPTSTSSKCKVEKKKK